MKVQLHKIAEILYLVSNVILLDLEYFIQLSPKNSKFGIF